jgi:hypothetical protein
MGDLVSNQSQARLRSDRSSNQLKGGQRDAALAEELEAHRALDAHPGHGRNDHGVDSEVRQSLPYTDLYRLKAIRGSC